MNAGKYAYILSHLSDASPSLFPLPHDNSPLALTLVRDMIVII